MNIKTSKKYIVFLIIGAIIILAFVAFLWYKSFDFFTRLLPCVAGVLSALVLVRVFFALGRKIYFHKDGCTVSFLFFKKQYSYKDLKTKNIEDFSQRLGGGSDSYERGVVFSVRENFHTPQILSITQYLLFTVNPFHFFVVFFQT